MLSSAVLYASDARTGPFGPNRSAQLWRPEALPGVARYSAIAHPAGQCWCERTDFIRNLSDA
jgi:hypothetical protein